jgi:hypothetical protein
MCHAPLAHSPAGTKPSNEAHCIKTAQKAGLCIPINFPAATKDCFGNGTCTQAGCACSKGYSGLYCEVSPSCTGAMASDRTCCATGVLSIDGSCCPAGSILDRGGLCCTGKKLDACGVCGGAGSAVDLQVGMALQRAPVHLHPAVRLAGTCTLLLPPSLNHCATPLSAHMPMHKAQSCTQGMQKKKKMRPARQATVQSIKWTTN